MSDHLWSAIFSVIVYYNSTWLRAKQDPAEIEPSLTRLFFVILFPVWLYYFICRLQPFFVIFLLATFDDVVFTIENYGFYHGLRLFKRYVSFCWTILLIVDMLFLLVRLDLCHICHVDGKMCLALLVIKKKSVSWVMKQSNFQLYLFP